MVSIIHSLLIYISFYFLTIKCAEDKECSRDKPIFNTIKQQCVLEYCTQSQFDDGTCVKNNSYSRIKWINSITAISTSNNSEIISNIALDGDNQNLLVETDIDKNKKLFFSLERKGYSYYDKSHFYYLENKDNNFLYNNYHPQSFIGTIDSHRIYYSFSPNESLFTYDLDSEIYSENILENILGHKVLSTYNSLMKTNNASIMTYAYLTTDYKIALQKLRLLSDGIEVVQTMIDDTKTLPRDSCK